MDACETRETDMARGRPLCKRRSRSSRRSSYQRTPAVSPSTELDNRPRFFKLILSPDVQMHELRIPQNFVAKHGKAFEKMANLHVPGDSTVWRVEMVSNGENMLLRKGWEKFADNYSLRYGYFLLFTYEGRSEFHVEIFNTTTREINYNECSKLVATNLPQASRGNDVVDEDDDHEINEVLDDHVEPERTIKTRQRRGKARKAAYPSPPPNRSTHLEDYTYFTIFMSESYVTNLCLAAVPVHGKTDHFTAPAKKKVIYLHGPGKKRTTIRCYFDKRKNQVRLRMNKFVIANKVMTGDTIVFHLMQGTHDSYKVTINKGHP